MQSDTQVFDNLDKIRHIPATIVQGRYDIVCPTETAWELHKVRRTRLQSKLRYYTVASLFLTITLAFLG